MRTISHKDLQNADLSTIGIIPLSNLFPIESKYGIGCPAYIHYDGSITRFFELNEIDTLKISEAINAMEYNSSMQIYKYHTPEEECYYLSVNKKIDYSDVIPNIIFKNLLDPISLQMNILNDLTSKAFESINLIVSLIPHIETDYLQSKLPHILIEYELRDNIIHGNQVRTNLSFLKTGIHKFGTIASLNNMSNIPQAVSCIAKHTYLERILLVAPSKEREMQLQLKVMENANLIQHLIEKRPNDYSADIYSSEANEIIPAKDKIYYSDVTFFLSADSVSELRDRFQSFFECMEYNDIALYCHTNTSRRTYISMFPGNEIYGERYTLMYEIFLNTLIKKVLEL